jgi:hypothetical protein
MGKLDRIEVTYVVDRRDLLFMYLGSWACRLAAAPGAAIILMAIVALPSPNDPPGQSLEVFAFGLALAIGGPLLLVLMVFGQYGNAGLVGKKVHLTIDESGVRGWPLAPYQDRTWPTIRRVHRLGGVITLPFRQFGTREGWVPIPARALTSEQRSALSALLVRKGLMKAPRAQR